MDVANDESGVDSGPDDNRGLLKNQPKDPGSF
jgi:hypothetical protein